MPTVSPYPVPSLGGPVVSALRDLPPVYQVTEQEFMDGGADKILDADEPLLRFALSYDGLLLHESGIIRSHIAEAKGTAYGFPFRHPRTGIEYEASYEEYEYSERSNIHSWEITLIVRP